MDKLHISKSILSITSPGTHLKPSDHALAARITRETNNELSEICSKTPDRFAFFASLPLPDVEGSIAESDHALDTLGALGFALMTNAHGVYLGDASLDPIFAHLNTRKAVIFMHPTQCRVRDNPSADKPLAEYPSPMLEFFFDTTRAVTNLLLTHTVTRNPNLTFLVSHCGATLPPLIERFTQFANIIGKDKSLTNDNVKELFRTRFFFDLAGFPFPDLIKGYLNVCDESRLLYGSDYPYTPGKVVEYLADTMDKGLVELFGEGKMEEIMSGHAKKLLNL